MTVNRRELCKLTGLAAAGASLASSVALGAGTNANTELSASRAANAHYKLKKLYHCVCYYPELWPEENIDADIKEMKTLGINVVRMGEFIWSAIEPVRGSVDLGIFKRSLDKFHAAGIDVVFCTPTATPPIWLTHGHPEHCFKDADGDIMSHGARQHASYAHPEVQKACFKIIDTIVGELASHPALIAWQIDNEMKAHVAEDFSDAAVVGWHRWLKDRYGNIAALNKAWATQIWSQYYQNFEQVPAPVKTPFMHSASLSTAYRLYSREAIVDFMKEQRRIIRKHSNLPITHNDNPAFNIHHEGSMEALDFAAFDAYPTKDKWGALVFRSDLYRAAIPGRPFWLMETSVAHNGWLGEHHPVHPKGYVAIEASLVYALGAEGFGYWLWRQQRAGVEISHSAIKSTWNEPSIGYEEVKAVNRSRELLEPLLTASKVASAEVALTYSDRARAMIETENLDKREGFPTTYRGVIEMWHAQLRDLGLHRDVRFEGAGLEGLKLLVTPAMPYVDAVFVKKIIAFVEAGGIWVAGPATGIRGEDHSIPLNAGLNLLDALLNVKTEFVVPLTDTGTKGEAFGITSELSGWCAAVQPLEGTEVKGHIRSGVAEGRAFITEHKLGKGRVVLLGAHPHGEQARVMLDRIVAHYADLAGVTERHEATAGTVVCPRITESGERLWVLINMDGKGGKVSLPGKVVDAVTGEKIRGKSLRVGAYQWQAVRFV